MTFDELIVICDKHNAAYKAALEEIVTAPYVTEEMKARIEWFREKDKYLSELHGHFTLEKAKAARAERDSMDIIDLFEGLRSKKTELS